MALHYDFSKIEDWEDVVNMTAQYDDPSNGVKKGDTIMNPVTNALIWLSISVDLPGITEANAGEFFARVRLTEQVFGPMLIRAEVDGVRPEGTKAFITMDEVIRHIGLSCNVSTVTRAKWLKRISREMDSSAARLSKKLATLQDAAALEAGVR